jgi:hypothetical protein
MREGDEDHTADAARETGLEQVGEPSSVGLGQEALRARREEHSREVDNGLDTFYRRRQRARIREVGTDRNDTGG